MVNKDGRYRIAHNIRRKSSKCTGSLTYLNYLNTAVSITHVTYETFTPFICLQFLLLHSCGCQLISDEYE